MNIQIWSEQFMDIRRSAVKPLSGTLRLTDKVRAR